ncbi:MAG: DUF4912 domain-containing protein [Cyanobacteria bacterium J06641_5]
MVPEYPRLEEMTLRQLRRVASEYRISRYSRLRKAQLLAAIQKVERDGTRRRLSLPQDASQAAMEASKYELGSPELAIATALGSVDANLPELPASYDDNRIVLMPRDPSLCLAYWDVPAAAELRRQGRQLQLRLYEAISDNGEAAVGSLQEYSCEPGTREMYLPVPLSDREYFVAIGYHQANGTWVLLAQSATVRVPPIYPSAWVEDRFATLDWEQDLQQQDVPTLQPPASSGVALAGARALLSLAAAGDTTSQRTAGSLLGYGLADELTLLAGDDIERLGEGRVLFPDPDRLQEIWPLLAPPGPDRGN